MNITNIKLIASRQLRATVEHPGFGLGILAPPLLFVLFLYFTKEIDRQKASQDPVQVKVALLNHSDLDFSPTDDVRVHYTSLHTSMPLVQATDSVRSGRFEALVYLPDTLSRAGKQLNVPLVVAKSIGWEPQKAIERSLSAGIKDSKMARSGVAVPLVKKAQTEIVCVEQNVVKSDERDLRALQKTGGTVVSYAMFILVYLAAALVMGSIAEEKQNRVVEVIASLVRPVDLIAGKIIGYGIVGLIILVAWAAVFGIYTYLATAAGPGSAVPMLVQSKPWGLLIPLYLLYFIGGYLFYAACFAVLATAGSDDPAEQSSMTFPALLVLVSGNTIFLAALDNPEGALYQFGCFFPFYTPMFMSARLLYDIEWGAIVVSLLLLYGSAFLGIFAAARIYRAGLLRYGKKASFREVWRWLKY